MSACEYYEVFKKIFFVFAKDSHRRCSIKKFKIFTGKHQSWSRFLIELQALSPASSFQRDRLLYMYFSVDIAKFLKTPNIFKSNWEPLVRIAVVNDRT